MEERWYISGSISLKLMFIVTNYLEPSAIKIAMSHSLQSGRL